MFHLAVNGYTISPPFGSVISKRGISRGGQKRREKMSAFPVAARKASQNGVTEESGWGIPGKGEASMVLFVMVAVLGIVNIHGVLRN